MKRNKIILLIYSIRIAVLVGLFVLALSLGGCKSTKQSSKTNLDVKMEANLDVKTNTESKQATEMVVIATDNGITNNNIASKTTITDFSAPDSTGKQHQIRKTVIEQTTSHKKIADSKVNTESKSKSESQVKQADNSDYKSDGTAKVETKETKKIQAPDWLSWSIVLLIIGLLWLTYLVLKRLKAVK